MVTPSFSPFSGRRNTRTGSYPPADRRQAGLADYPDPRGYPFWATEDELPAPRKRIAVACGRCRKRKIRCSGDTGNGLPCTNCRNAGHESCMYLRVASQETQIKSQPFVYNLDASRQYHTRDSASTPSHNLAGDAASTHETAPYRTSQPPMAFHDRGFDAVPAWPAAITVNQIPFNTPYGMPITMRGSHAMAPAPRDDVGQPEPTETYSAAHTMASLTHRPATDDSASVAATAGSTPEDSLPTPSTSQSHPDVTTDAAAAPAVVANASTSVNSELAVRTSTEGRASALTSMSSQYLQETSPTSYVRHRGHSPQSSSSGSGPLTPGSETGTTSGYSGFDYPTITPTVLPFPLMVLSGPAARTSGSIYGPAGASTTSSYVPSSVPTSSARSTDMTYRYIDTTVSETGEPLVGLLQRHPSPVTEAALALTQQSRGIYGVPEPQQAPSYVVPSNDGVSLTQRESPEEDSKPAVVHP